MRIFDKRRPRWILQRLIRGFSDRQTWCLDYNIAKFVLPRLKRFREVHAGYPSDLTEEKWIEYLDDMIYAMTVSILEGKYGICADDHMDIDWDRVERGHKLFGEYFRRLWW